MLGTIRDWLGIGPVDMRKEILRMHGDTISILASKGIDYAPSKICTGPQG